MILQSSNVFKLVSFTKLYGKCKRLTFSYEILAELQNQGKQIMLCKFLQTRIKRNEADIVSKVIPGITTRRLSYTNYYYLTIRRPMCRDDIAIGTVCCG